MRYEPENYLQTIPEQTDICSLEEIGSRTGTVFEIFANKNRNLSINALFDTGASKSVMSYKTFKKLKLEKLDSRGLPHIVGASGESLGAVGKTSCKIQINNKTFIQTFIVCEHPKRPLILGRDFSIQNHMGISWTKHNTRQLTQYNEVIAETKEYQPTSRSSVSLKNNVKVPPRSCAVIDVDVNTTEQIKVEIQPDELWLNSNPNICTYPLIADLKEKKSGDTTPFIIVNFSHNKYLHLPKDHVVAFAQQDSNEGEVLELSTMKELEQELPRNWIPKRKTEEKLSELFENPFMRKKDDFLKSPADVPAHRKVILDNKNISSKTKTAFEQLCEKYDKVISKKKWQHRKDNVNRNGDRYGKPPTSSFKTLHSTTETLRMGPA